ncbi:MAG TPA: electron transfer flavoprotein subunit alpha/FixB family protein, partial [Geobacteraceae bacterium]
MAAHAPILVFVDLPDGSLDETGKGILSYASRLAGILGCGWEAVTATPPDAAQTLAFGACGTPAITTLAADATLFDAPAHLGSLLARLAAAKGARIVLLPHNDLGSTLAPVLAVALDTAISTETTAAVGSGAGLKL